MVHASLLHGQINNATFVGWVDDLLESVNKSTIESEGNIKYQWQKRENESKIWTLCQ